MSYETIKTVNGIEIFRAIGTKFPYYINNKGDKRTGAPCSYYTFKTCKAAAAFAATLN